MDVLLWQVLECIIGESQCDNYANCSPPHCQITPHLKVSLHLQFGMPPRRQPAYRFFLQLVSLSSGLSGAMHWSKTVPHTTCEVANQAIFQRLTLSHCRSISLILLALQQSCQRRRRLRSCIVRSTTAA